MCIELSKTSPWTRSTPIAITLVGRAAKRARGRPDRRHQDPPDERAQAERRARKKAWKEKQARRAAEPAAPVAPPGRAVKLPAFARNVEGLVRAFEDATLAREDWTHAAHLVVALSYAHRHRLEAYTRLRDGIRRYNAATGLVETPTRGFHETITRAWFQLVLHFLDLFDDGRPLQALATDLIEVYERDELFRHFSRERLLAAGARAGWVEPDRAPLPELEPLTPSDRRWLAALEARVAAVEVEVVVEVVVEAELAAV
jgi:hypothetical protein